MSMLKPSISFLLFFSFLSSSFSQDEQRKINFPNTSDYLVLICDFHTHSVFSDGSVWPDIRVQEAVKDGLDALAITEHIEYQPHREDIPNTDRNRSYQLAEEYARPYDLLVIPGAEITRDLPPGHANALFIQDANKLNVKEPIDAYKAAKAQGAFIFWNHPDWIGQNKDGLPVWTPVHEMLKAEELIHGIEVVNDLTYSEAALQIALDQNLSAIGTSDIHGLVDWQYMIPDGGHRPVSLVFAKERSLEGIKEALFAGRTIAWYNDILIGPTHFLQKITDASLSTKNRGFIGSSNELEIEISNNSDAKLILENTSNYQFHNQPDVITISGQSSVRISIITKSGNGPLTFEVINAIGGSDQHPQVVFNFED